MKTRGPGTRARAGVRYVVLALLGGLTGALLGRFLLPAAFERVGPSVFLVLPILLVGVLVLARVLGRGGPRQ